MNEDEKSELYLLRQAIARLSDRMERMEQKQRAIDRAQSLSVRPPETGSQIPERDKDFIGADAKKSALESAPRSQNADAARIQSPVPQRLQPPVPAPSPAAPAQQPVKAAPPPAPAKPEITLPEKKRVIAPGPVPLPELPKPQIVPVEKKREISPASVAAFAVSATPEPATPAAAAEAPKPAVAHKDRPRRDIELNIGKYWLNKIGIGVFVLGIGFLIAYSSRYFGHFGPWGKILTGYLVSAALFFTGWKLQQSEKMANFGHVITGGAWALAYFTTFAMQHFPQSRVLQSEGADMILLAAVAAGMLIYSLKYHSEALSGVAIFVGYATATIGDVRLFTLASCAIESIVILVLVYRFKWLRMMFMGILMTYGAHFLWVMKNMHGAASADPLLTAKSFFLLNGTFLTLYWAVFTAGIHLLRKPDDEAVENNLSVANIGNALFYFLLLYPDITRLFPDQRFNFVVSLGAAFLLLGGSLYASGKGRLFACDALIGIALITAAVPIRYMTLETALIWIAELPLLCYAGIELKSRTIRAAGFLLFIWTMLHYALYVAGGAGSVEIMGLGIIPMAGFTAFAAALSFGGVFALLRRAFARGMISGMENSAAQLFPAAAAAFLGIGTLAASAPGNLTLYIYLDALLLFTWGYFAGETSIRSYAILFLGGGLFRFTGTDDYMTLTAVRRWAYIVWETLCSYSIYFLYRDLRSRGLLQETEKAVVTGVAAASGLLVVAAIFRYVPENWITIAFSGLSLLTFCVGYLSDSFSLRSTALAGSLIAAGRFIFVDSFPSGGPADWAVIIFVPLSQAAIYYFYRVRRAAGKLSRAETLLPDAEYALFQITAMALVLRYVPDGEITPLFAAMNLALFAAGCLLREKFVRGASLLILPVVLCRFISIDNYPEGARLWPLTVVLGSYYALVYAYKKAGAMLILEKDELPLTHLAFAAAAFLTASAIWQYAPDQWAAACLALAGLGAFVHGYFFDSADLRVSGSALLFATLTRAVLWDDYSSLGAFMRWASPAIEMFCFGAAYLLYRKLRLAGKLLLVEMKISQALFAGFSVIVCVSIIRYCPQYWASGVLAAFAAATFFAGRALDEQFVRVGATLLFGAVAFRAGTFSEPYENLGALRWMPIGAQLAALLAVYLPYREMTKTGAAPEEEKPVPLAVYAALIGLLLFYVVNYAEPSVRPLIFTAGYLILFICGAARKDVPLRAAWMPLVQAAVGAYFYAMPYFSKSIYELGYAAVMSGGMYAVYGFSKGRLKPVLSAAEKQFLPALCLLASAVTAISVNHYVPDIYKTAAASGVLLVLYLAGAALQDEALARSAFAFMPYIFFRRLGIDDYTAVGPLVKWGAVLAAPAAFFGIHLAWIKRPERVFKNVDARIMACAGIVPGVVLLFHALFFYAGSSVITLSLGLSGLALFAPGFLFKDKLLRYSGLLMFAAAVLRIGIVDIAGLPIIYKIISFILMGLILLGVSYVYTRFMDEEPAGPEK